MTPEDFLDKADIIADTRPLKTHQLYDLITVCDLVRKRGVVTALDEFYLDIVGVRPRHFGHYPQPRLTAAERKKRDKERQGSLF